MPRPTKEVRHLAAADKLYEACQIATMRLQWIMEKRSAKDRERKADRIVLKVISDAMKLYEGPEG